jgi:uncharacterized protein YndB with AHSA1/START domain
MAESMDQFMLNVRKEIEIAAPPDVVFGAILEQNGSGFTKMGGEAMPMKLEAWPGGRWFRDTGDNNGHFWGHVQVIKPPTLLEICGPMFMSFAVASHAQYRVTATDTGSRLQIIHTAFGNIPAELRQGVNGGWQYIIDKIKERATR